MIVQASIDEINDVIEYFNPKYPKQNLETLETNRCFYVLNQVPVEIIIKKENKKDGGQ